MTGLTVSTAGSAIPSVSGAAPSVLTAGAPAGVPNLAAFLDMMTDQAVPTTVEHASLPDGQDDAGPGNSLPDQGDDTNDSALAWLMSGLAGTALPPLPILPKFQPELAQAALPVGQEAAAVSPTPLAGSAIAVAPAAATQHTETASDMASLPAATVFAVAPEIRSANQTTVDPVKPRVTAPDPVASASASAPVPLAAIISANASAVPPSPALAFAARTAVALPAMFALAASRREDRDGETAVTPAITGASLLQPADAARLIAQPGELDRQSLDTGRQDWPQKMIDRIEVLRDNANANDTSIRLKPEALGRVDISIRNHSDGAVSVRFTAEQPAARALIADAQPLLAAAADARGIRLSGTSVDLTGSGQGGNDRPRQQFDPNRNISNSLASGGDDSTADSDGRIA